MKYPDEWEKAKKIRKIVVEDIINPFCKKTKRKKHLVIHTVNGGHWNNSTLLMIYAQLIEGMSEEEILDLVNKRLDSYVIFMSNKNTSINKKQEDLDFYIKIQTQLGNYNKEEYRKNE